MNKLILADETNIVVEDGSSLSAIRVLSESKDKMLVAWSALTPDNLKTVRVLNGDDIVVGEYTNLILVSETSVVLEDNSVATVFNLREKTELELLTERVDELESNVEADMTALNEVIGGM